MIDPFTEDAEGAAEDIAEFGEVCTWTKPAANDPDADPWREVRIGAPTVFFPSLAFFSPLDLARGRGQFQMLGVGTDVLETLEIGLLAGNCGFVPELRDTLERTSGLAQIIAIDKVAPNGTPVLYFIGVK